MRVAKDRDDFPVVAIGASAGGLEACRRLLHALPADTGMAFILVQHLDPNHESMLVDLLSSATTMAVVQASEGMPIVPDHLYVIPPGRYLSVAAGALHISQPEARHGARLPFDHLLTTLALAYGRRGICVILSGTGADGCLGLKAVKQHGGMVLAQDPTEASYDGMPRSAIATGLVDRVLPVAEIPSALSPQRAAPTYGPEAPAPASALDHLAPDHLARVIGFLRGQTEHDFTHYKPGTLQRRIERRMAMAALAADDVERYLEILRTDQRERDLLIKDLLINVTSFFRDPRVFDVLAVQVIPGLIHGRGSDQPIRLWVAGCSTGEETYSLVMLFREAITAAKLNIRLQVFASDVDPEAVATAREGLYPEAIAKNVSPARLSRFFVREEQGYRVSPELRAVVVFTIQDVLADPPFSRLDMISCRNLLIYLMPDAQTKVLSLFHFALVERGILLLGSSETVGGMEGNFEVIAKSERIYRHVGRARAGELGAILASADGTRLMARSGPGQPPSRDAAYGELCRRVVLETYAPAAVLITHGYEQRYALGPIDRYLRVTPGTPTHDLLAMARPGLRTRIRAAVHEATTSGARVVVAGGRGASGDGGGRFSIAVHPLQSEGEALLLLCFLDEPAPENPPSRAATPGESQRIAELEQELAATSAELQGAIRNLEISGEDQRIAHEEALSINEEFQSTNEELLTSKEELQSLNEELTALNTQLQETLERQRTTSNDLQNILYSTDVATLFLDRALNIRFFTPATRALFNIIPGDVGRPLRDLTSLAVDRALAADARAVLRGAAAIEREVETDAGTWFVRRILPYRGENDAIDGVVLTFTDITERKRTAEISQSARQQAEFANVAKSRFLAAASHDLRQPLQSIALVQGLLAQTVQGERARALVARLDETLGAMASMLNTLLDINQLEVGAVQPEIVAVPVDAIFAPLQEEFLYHAEARGLALRVVPCGATIATDARLLGQMIRNLLSNAVKYTGQGRLLLGCRRHGRTLRIEIWDTGIGIPDTELNTIFEEYHQLGNPARERSRGLGLGLAIVRRLGDLLGHRVSVRSRMGRGSMFAIEVALAPEPKPSAAAAVADDDAESAGDILPRLGAILVVEDDPEVSDLLTLLLEGAGHRVARTADGGAALDPLRRGGVRPDLIIADYNLPGAMDGLRLTAALREAWGRQIPAILLTGDISLGAMRDVARAECLLLYKPVKVPQLMRAIQRLLPPAPAVPAPAPRATVAPDTVVIYVVDDDKHICNEIRAVLEADGRVVEDYASGEAFLAAYRPDREACLLLDAYLPGMSGLAVLQRLREIAAPLPAIVITGRSDVAMAVQAMKAGAEDFIEKPISRTDLLAAIARALDQARDQNARSAWRATATSHIKGLTRRQREIMDRVLAGQPNKNIAADLGISQRTVENHRAKVMQRTGARSLPALTRLAMAADEPTPES